MEVWCCEGEGLGRGVGYIASRTGKVSAMLISPGAKVACLTETGPPCSLTDPWKVWPPHWKKTVDTEPAAQVVGRLLFPKQIWVAHLHGYLSYQEFANFTILNPHHQRKTDTFPLILWKDVNGPAGFSAKTCSKQLCPDRRCYMWLQRHGMGSPPYSPMVQETPFLEGDASWASTERKRNRCNLRPLAHTTCFMGSGLERWFL